VKLTGKQEAQSIAVACTPAPEGRNRWTLWRLADKVVELGFCRRDGPRDGPPDIQQNALKLWQQRQW
jgi:hypothetical protein